MLGNFGSAQSRANKLLVMFASGAVLTTRWLKSYARTQYSSHLAKPSQILSGFLFEVGDKLD